MLGGPEDDAGELSLAVELVRPSASDSPTSKGSDHPPTSPSRRGPQLCARHDLEVNGELHKKAHVRQAVPEVKAAAPDSWRRLRTLPCQTANEVGVPVETASVHAQQSRAPGGGARKKGHLDVPFAGLHRVSQAQESHTRPP